MDVVDLAAGVSSDGSEIAFRLPGQIGGAGYAFTRETLEVHSWLPVNDDASRMLRTFDNVRNRIVAVVEKNAGSAGRPS